MTNSLVGLVRDKEKKMRGTMINNPINFYYPSKTDQIMSRYRPIAPRPQLTMKPILEGPSTPEKTPQSPFFRTLSPHLQTKPSRSRKRGKSGISPATRKRAKTHFSGFSSPTCGVASLAKNTQLGLSLQGFDHGFPRSPLPISGFSGSSENPINMVALPLLPCPSSVPEVGRSVAELHGMNPYSQLEKSLDLNLMTEIPQVKDLLQNMRAPVSGPPNSGEGCGNVIVPQPVRPIWSSISVDGISKDPTSNPTACITKKPEEVEAEVESDPLPAVVSDSNNKVRLANSAYKEMVGQPECVWLDSMATNDEQLSGRACKRISGDVMLDLSNSPVPISSNGFSCRVSIEWTRNGKKSFINAPCDVVRLSCVSKDYLFTWRFHTREPSESNSKA